MAKQSQTKFIKRQKEVERMRKAKEKMERRHGRKNKATESDGSQMLEQSSDLSNIWTHTLSYPPQVTKTAWRSLLYIDW